MSVKLVEAKSTVVKRWRNQTLSAAKRNSGLINDDFITKNGGYGETAVAIEHEEGMQKKQHDAKPEKTTRRLSLTLRASCGLRANRDSAPQRLSTSSNSGLRVNDFDTRHASFWSRQLVTSIRGY